MTHDFSGRVGKSSKALQGPQVDVETCEKLVVEMIQWELMWWMVRSSSSPDSNSCDDGKAN